MKPTLIKETRPRAVTPPDTPDLSSPDFPYLEMLYRLRPGCRGRLAEACEREIRRTRRRIHVR